MKKILITSEKFTGSVVLLYGDSGIGEETWPPLLAVDFGAAVISDQRKAYLLAKLPMRYGEGFAQSWGTDSLKFAEEDTEYDFERDFWIPYDKKVNKDRCLKVWNNMTRADKALAVVRLAAYKRYLSKHQWRSLADPESYLKKKMYLTDWDNLKD